MAKPRTPNQKKAYAALKGRLNQYSYMVQTIYDTLNAEAARLALSTDYDGEREFSWDDFPQTQKRIADLQARFVGDIGSVVYTGTSQEWAESNLLQDLLVTKVLKSYKAQVHGKKYAVYYQTNSEALKAFQERADNGMNLSARLWKQSQGYRRELECAIGAAVEKGTSAITLSKRISKYLTNYDQLKADYKEKFGKAADCHDCEYNSIRLARTEINMAYRTAEQKRWQQLDFVLGYEIKLSGSHPVTDICDELKGRYPKDFVWTGWHPSCMCYSIPILKTEEEFWADDDTPSVNAVTDVPEKVHEWVGENAERLEKAAERGTLPYWLRDNPGLMEGVTAKRVEPALREIIEEKKDIHDMLDTSRPFRGDEPGLPPHIDTYTKEAEHVFVSLFNREAELDENIRLARFLAEKTGDDVFVLPHFQPTHPASANLRKEYFPEGVKENKNPDLFYRSRFVDEKSMHPEDVSDAKKTKRKIQFRLKEAFEQADDAFIEIPTSIPKEWVESAIRGKLNSSNRYHVVYVKYGSEYMKYESKNKPAPQ